jgi:YVTN family beta-propeller protein
MTPDGRQVYVTSEGDSRVSVIDASANRVVAHFDVPARPRAVAFSPDGARAYVTSENGGTVSVVNAKTHKVTTTITLTGENVKPMGVVVSPDGQRVFVSTGRGGSVIVIDAAKNSVIGSVKVGDRPWGIVLSPDGKLLYTANGPSNDVSIVDVETLTVVGKIKVGQRPWGITVAPAPWARTATGNPVGTLSISPHQSGASTLTTMSFVATIKSGVPMAQVLPSSNCRGGGMSAGFPCGAPLSAHLPTLAISSALSEGSFLYF